MNTFCSSLVGMSLLSVLFSFSSCSKSVEVTPMPTFVNGDLNEYFRVADRPLLITEDEGSTAIVSVDFERTGDSMPEELTNENSSPSAPVIAYVEILNKEGTPICYGGMLKVMSDMFTREKTIRVNFSLTDKLSRQRFHLGDLKDAKQIKIYLYRLPLAN